MRIVQVAAEFAPIAKAGGLGEVLLGLSRELTLQHHQVDVILPKYSLIEAAKLQGLTAKIPSFQSVEKGNRVTNTAWSALVEECQLHLLDPHEVDYFRRGQIYGYPDDAARFLYFSRAVMDYLVHLKQPIDVLHIHDWHTAACAPLLRDLYASKLKVKKLLFTIHNLEYQGRCAPWDLEAIGLKAETYLKPNRLQDDDPRYPNTINLLKGALLYADAVNTVSSSYAQEIQHPETGFGLEKILKRVGVTGIVNGIDDKIWNPEKDPNLSVRYQSADPLMRIQEAKNENKRKLQQRFGLNCENKPLVGAVTRLVPQKGTHLLEAAIEMVLEMDGAFMLLGSSPVPEIQQQFNALKERYKQEPRVVLEYTYSDPLAHQLFAAMDFILVPSLFEPCGLSQLIAMRYGTIPIVRATGGLQDTVFDCENSQIPLDKRNGFVFREPTPDALRKTLHRAFSFWHAEQPTRLAMLRRMMQTDYSWRNPAREYLKLYLAQKR